MKALDLFCGLGGWSDGLVAEGFDVMGVEIEPKIATLYKHPVIVADVCDLNPEDFKGYDLIVGSPPCREFTILNDARWKRKKNPEQGLILVNAFLNFINKAEPTYWLMENVFGLKKYLKLKPRCTVILSHSMRRTFWGNFPAFFVVKDNTKPSIGKTSGFPWIASWERARIPLPVARALGVAVKNAEQKVDIPRVKVK